MIQVFNMLRIKISETRVMVEGNNRLINDVLSLQMGSLRRLTHQRLTLSSFLHS